MMQPERAQKRRQTAAVTEIRDWVRLIPSGLVLMGGSVSEGRSSVVAVGGVDGRVYVVSSTGGDDIKLGVSVGLEAA